MPDDYTLTIDEFLRLEKISRTTLFKLWREGRGPAFHKIGRRTLISAEARDAWRKRMIEETQKTAA